MNWSDNDRLNARLIEIQVRQARALERIAVSLEGILEIQRYKPQN